MWDSRELDSIEYVVIHHTATRNDLSAEEMELSMRRTYVENRWYEIIPVHYIIDRDGWFKKVNDMWVVVGATLNGESNMKGVHIELVWNFDKEVPSDAQYKMLNKLIGWIKEKAVNVDEVKWHKDFQNKTCPGKNFDFSRVGWLRVVEGGKSYEEINVVQEEEVRVVDDGKYEGRRLLWQGRITAYYTSLKPCGDWWSSALWNCQTRYFQGRTFEQEIAMNGDFVNAQGWDYKEDHRYTHGACDKRYKWRTLFVEGWWEVYCSDVWGWIVGNEVDIWYGIWQNALWRIDWKDGDVQQVIHPQQASVYLVE